MRTRHRVPTLFTLSMMDVFCCALGCVILLWLLNSREARMRAKAAGETDTKLSIARGELALARSSITDLERERDNLRVDHVFSSTDGNGLQRDRIGLKLVLIKECPGAQVYTVRYWRVVTLLCGAVFRTALASDQGGVD